LESKDLLNEPLHRWLTYFDEQTEEKVITEVLAMDAAIQKTNDRLNFLSQDKEFLHRANLRDITLSDFTTAMNDAKNEGREEAEKKFESEKKDYEKKIEKLEEELKNIKRLIEK